MALKPVTTYGDTATSTTASSITFDNTLLRQSVSPGGTMQLEITVVGAACVINLTGAAASAILSGGTKGSLTQGNSYAAAGTVRTLEIPTSATQISYVTLSGTGSIWINAGYGEQV